MSFIKSFGTAQGFSETIQTLAGHFINVFYCFHMYSIVVFSFSLLIFIYVHIILLLFLFSQAASAGSGPVALDNWWSGIWQLALHLRCGPSGMDNLYLRGGEEVRYRARNLNWHQTFGF